MCVYIYIYIHIYIYIYISLSIYIYIYTHVCVFSVNVLVCGFHAPLTPWRLSNLYGYLTISSIPYTFRVIVQQFEFIVK